jgi:hypothetical protein
MAPVIFEDLEPGNPSSSRVVRPRRKRRQGRRGLAQNQGALAALGPAVSSGRGEQAPQHADEHEVVAPVLDVDDVAFAGLGRYLNFRACRQRGPWGRRSYPNPYPGG